MASYEVIGTDYVVSGMANRWFVYKKPIRVGNTSKAGPFKTRKLAIDWVTENAKSN